MVISRVAVSRARVSTLDQNTLAMQIRALRNYANTHGWAIAVQVKEAGPGEGRHREIAVSMAAGPLGTAPCRSGGEA
jgi:DNA invertase Pin-like site-specific DNA recombinase